MEQTSPTPPAAMTPRRVTWLGLTIDCVLAVSKILVALLLGSRALLADGFHAASDMVTDVVVLAGLHAGEKPPDAGHPYGHRRIETLVGVFIGAALLAAAGWIIYDALAALRGPAAAGHGVWPFVMALASVPVKEILFRVTRAVGRRTRNITLHANAWHHRTDAFTSIAAAAGLAGAAFGGAKWQFLDPVTALVLASFLIVVGVRIIAAGASELVDRAPGQDVILNIKQAVARTRGVVSFHAIRARRIGGRVDMDIHVQVDPTLTVEQGHAIASAVKWQILESQADVASVVVHIEPAGKVVAGSQ